MAVTVAPHIQEKAHLKSSALLSQEFLWVGLDAKWLGASFTNQVEMHSSAKTLTNLLRLAILDMPSEQAFYIEDLITTAGLWFLS